MKTIILTGGGTAGHCTPNLALMPYLTKKFDKIIYIGSKNGIEKKLCEEYGLTFYSLSSTPKFKRGFNLSNLLIPFELNKAVKEARKLISKIKPNIIFSKGGYVSLPVVIAGKQLDVPVVAHESDYSIGLANKISLKYCDRFLTAFPDTAKNIPCARYVGSPIRQTLFNGKKDFSLFAFSGEKPVLLIFGGSLGAKAINDCTFRSIESLIKFFDIIHVVGKNNINKEYAKIKGYYQTEFLTRFEDALSISSVCVLRGGANSLFEMLALNKPCVVVPLPKGNSRGDQEQNANYFFKKGLIYLLPEKCLTENSLFTAVTSVYQNRQNFKKIIKGADVNDKSEKIVENLLEVASD